MPRSYRVDPIWAGQRVVIIGGGPSVTPEQIHRIARAKLAGAVKVIAVNDAIYLAWWADWLHACDSSWWNVHYPTVHTFNGIRTTLDECVPDRWRVGCLRNTGKHGFDPDPANCRTGANSIYQAIHCCIHAGAREVVLVGCDMRRTRDRSHWHAGHGGPDVDYANVMAPCFDTIVPTLEERRVRVINASPGTALKTFQTAPLEDALS